jgi:hypothetical protein
MNEGMQNLKEIEDLENKFKNEEQLYQLTQGITRIANYMEEILRLVKKDQEESKKRWEESNLGE